MTTEADIIEERRVPDRAEVAALLARYFEPSPPEVAERLHAVIVALVADSSRHRAADGSFRANGRRYFGQAWKEDLSRGRSLPRVLDLVAWIAVTERGYPAPKLYCPVELVGRWQQQVPSRARWLFATNSDVTTDDAELASAKRWCVHRRVETGPAGDELWLYESEDEDEDPRYLSISEFGATMRLTLINARVENVPYELVSMKIEL